MNRTALLIALLLLVQGFARADAPATQRAAVATQPSADTTFLNAQEKERATVEEHERPVLPPTEFESRVAEMRTRLELNGEKSAPLADSLLQRLREYRSVTAATVINVVHAIRTEESKAQLAKDEKRISFSFPDTKRFIDMAMPLIKGSAQIEAELLAEKGKILEQEGDVEGAASAFQKAVNAVTSLGNDIDVCRIQSLAMWSSSLTRSGQKPQAEKAYRLVLSYDWYKVQDPSKQRRLMELYLEAGRGLIELNRHNLKGLQEIFFVPSTLEELGPVLRDAISEAKMEETTLKAPR